MCDIWKGVEGCGHCHGWMCGSVVVNVFSLTRGGVVVVAMDVVDTLLLLVSGGDGYCS